MEKQERRSALRAQALDMYMAAVIAADPELGVDQFFQEYSLIYPVGGKCHIIAIGKASLGMMKSALRHVPASLIGHTLAVTNYENEACLEGVAVIAAGHPVPDTAGALAAQSVEQIARSAAQNDLLLVLVSGGGSSLLPAPLEGITLEDKIAVNRLLLGCGANIQETNLVRQNLSRLKGGGLARLAHPARVHSLVLSDVIGDDLRYVASGPTAASIGTAADAIKVLGRLGVLDQVPEAVRDLLMRPATAPSPAVDGAIDIVGSNSISLTAMQNYSSRSAKIVSGNIVQPVDEAAVFIASHAETAPKETPLLFGGETTVTIRGDGLGGRNQELALRFALEAERRAIDGPWVFLSGGTDGRDGPTTSAGACVDDTTLSRIRRVGGDPVASLANSDSYHALLLSGDHIEQWPSRTNVADVQVFIGGNELTEGTRLITAA